MHNYVSKHLPSAHPQPREPCNPKRTRTLLRRSRCGRPTTSLKKAGRQDAVDCMFRLNLACAKPRDAQLVKRLSLTCLKLMWGPATARDCRQTRATSRPSQPRRDAKKLRAHAHTHTHPPTDTGAHARTRSVIRMWGGLGRQRGRSTLFRAVAARACQAATNGKKAGQQTSECSPQLARLA